MIWEDNATFQWTSNPCQISSLTKRKNSNEKSTDYRTHCLSYKIDVLNTRCDFLWLWGFLCFLFIRQSCVIFVWFEFSWCDNVFIEVCAILVAAYRPGARSLTTSWYDWCPFLLWSLAKAPRKHESIITYSANSDRLWLVMIRITLCTLCLLLRLSRHVLS